MLLGEHALSLHLSPSVQAIELDGLVERRRARLVHMTIGTAQATLIDVVLGRFDFLVVDRDL